MNPTEYIIDVLSNFRLIFIFIIIYPLLLGLNWIIFKNFFNALAVLVFASAIVFSVFIDLIYNNSIDNYRLLYFIFSDFLLYIIILLIYKRILITINKNQLLLIVKNFNDKYFLIAVIWLVFGIFINLQNVSWDGVSRIAFQTARWYSFFRMISILINPIIGLLLIYNLYNNNKLKLLILLLLIIFTTASAGSKSGFVFAFVMSFLLYNDLINITHKLKAKIYIPLILFIVFAAILNFIFIGVDSDKIFERIVHYAEATIMVFPSKNPCLVCEKQSFIALLHRGFGRLFNDSSSLIDNNLFGFALSSEFYGQPASGITMTGPNARIGAYSICAFPGIKIIILYLIFIIFGAINYVLIKITERKKSFIYVSSLLVVIDTLQHFILDYNTAMSNLTLIIFIYIFLTLSFILKFDLKQDKLST